MAKPQTGTPKVAAPFIICVSGEQANVVWFKTRSQWLAISRRFSSPRVPKITQLARSRPIISLFLCVLLSGTTIGYVQPRNDQGRLKLYHFASLKRAEYTPIYLILTVFVDMSLIRNE